MDKIPEKELGQPGAVSSAMWWEKNKPRPVAPLEQIPELRFPQSIGVYNSMRSDGHAASVLEAMSQPIIGARWDLITGGVEEKVVNLVRTECGVPAPGMNRARRRRHGMSLRKHMGDVLASLLWAGFSAFEQVYEVSEPGDGQDELGLDFVVHLRKLAPRLPSTVEKIVVEKDGGLHSLVQVPVDGMKPIVIPVNQLVIYTNKQEGADFYGRSVFRPAYRHWLIKDILIRLDAQAAERNSMGVPVLYFDPNSNNNSGFTQDMAQAFVENFRAGANSGGTLPPGATIELVGTKGTIMDLIPHIKYHDQEITRSVLAMFLDMGHDNGARSLGEVQLNVFMGSLQTIAEQIADTFTEHVIRDLVEYNFGIGTPYPTLTPGDLKANTNISAEVLKMLVEAGVVNPDDVLEAQQREVYGLPPADPATRRERNVGSDGKADGFVSQVNREHVATLGGLIQRVEDRAKTKVGA